MSQDRLSQLLKQKQLIQDHLAWIEQEIAKQKDPADALPAGRPSEPSNRLAALQPKERLPSPEAANSPGPSNPHPVVELYDTLGPDKKSAAQETKRGCLLLFALAMGSMAAALGLVYYLY